MRYAYSSKDAPILSIKQWQLHLGDRVFLYGDSGSGKTTLLNLLCGIVLTNCGRIVLFDEEINIMTNPKRDAFRAQNIGVVFQKFNLIPYLSVPTNNIKYESFVMLQEHELVEWAIPISLGDSHRGFRVMGTTGAYFSHYRYGKQQSLDFRKGKQFNGLFDAVIGADVAKSLGYKLNDKIIIAHGIGRTSFAKHEQAPFVISGILAVTGTPVDKTVHVSLQAIEAVHMPPAALQTVINEPAGLMMGKRTAITYCAS